MFKQGSHRQPRRDRASHHAHAAAHGHRLGGGVLRRRTRAPCTSPPADEAVGIGGPRRGRELPRRRSRSWRPRTRTGAEAIHPGYGFLAENAEFAGRCEAAGIAFIGPTPEQIRALRSQAHGARAGDRGRGAAACRAPALLTEHRAGAARRRDDRLPGDAEEHGRRRRHRHAPLRRRRELGAGLRRGRRAWRSANFKRRGRLPREVRRPAPATSRCRSSATARAVLALGERDCSLQRRNQKVIEETPPPGLADETRARAGRGGGAPGARGALPLGGHGRVHRRPAGTRRFYFLEVNTRIQVEHGVTEEVTGVDLVEWMVRVAAGELAAGRRGAARARRRHRGAHLRRGSAARLPAQRGRADRGRRSPTACASRPRSIAAARSRPYYDPMLAKMIAQRRRRARRRARALRDALGATRVWPASRPTATYLHGGAGRRPRSCAGDVTRACSTRSSPRAARSR